MKRFLGGLALLILGLWCLAPEGVPHVKAQFSDQCADGFCGSGATTAVFKGEGDIVPGALAFWGLQAYTQATRGNKLINACHSTAGADDGCADLHSDATTGKLVPAVVDG